MDEAGSGALYSSVENLIIPIFRVHRARVYVYVHIYCGKYRNDSSVKRHSSSFEFPARNIITRRTCTRSTSILKTFICRRSRWRTRPYKCPVRVHKYAHAQRQNARCDALIIERRTMRMRSSGKLRTVFPTLAYEVSLPKAQEGKMEGRKRVLRKSNSHERLSRQVSCSTLRAAARFPSRAARKRILDFFRENAVRLFAICVCAAYMHICAYRGRNLFAINLARNRTRYRESNSVPAPKKYGSRLERQSSRMSIEKEAWFYGNALIQNRSKKKYYKKEISKELKIERYYSINKFSTIHRGSTENVQARENASLTQSTHVI